MDLVHALHVPAGEGPFPTVVGLHGWGANALDLLGLAPVLHGGRALVLCPQGPVAFQVAPGMAGFGWFPLRPGRLPDPEEFAEGAARLRRFLEAALASYPIDAHKLVLLGFSQGGVMAYDLFLEQPERFAALVALSSWLPPWLRERHPPRPAHRGRPVLVVHGSRDPMIDVERGRESRDALLPYGVDLSYREYEMGHEIAPDALRTLVEWLDDRVLQPIRLA